MHDHVRSILISSALAACVAASLSACSLGKKGKSDQSETLQAEIEADTRTRNSERGLQLRVLNVDDTGDRVAAALARYADDSGTMRPQDRDRWNQWGLRWIVVPQSELESILSEMDLTNAIQIRWMGEFPQWRPIIRTGELSNSTIRIGVSAAPIHRTLHGIPRLLARVWTKPELTESGLQSKLHLDLAIQLKRESEAARVWREPTLTTAIDEGPLIEELTMSQSLDESSALILVGVDPSIQWDASNQIVHDDGASKGVGPSAPGARTLGQRMLSTPGSGYVAQGVRYNPPKKVMIVLVPKTDDDYRILAPSQPRSDSGGTP